MMILDSRRWNVSTDSQGRHLTFSSWYITDILIRAIEVKYERDGPSGCLSRITIILDDEKYKRGAAKRDDIIKKFVFDIYEDGVITNPYSDKRIDILRNFLMEVSLNLPKEERYKKEVGKINHILEDIVKFP